MCIRDRGKAIPYGVYDVANNEGWVSVGDTADTSEFAVAAIDKWLSLIHISEPTRPY